MGAAIVARLHADPTFLTGRSGLRTGNTKVGLPGAAQGLQARDVTIVQLLKALHDLGMAEDPIVMYSTDNGPHMNSWPDAAMTPFRNEKNSNWEGAYRVPCMIK